MSRSCLGFGNTLKFIVLGYLTILILGLIQAEDIRAEDIKDDKSEIDEQQLRATVLSNLLSNSEMVIYEAQGEETGTVFVLTSVNCPYCVKFHQEVSFLNEHGITVKYLPFPLRPKGTEVYSKMVSIWNNPDRKLALERALSRFNGPVDMAYADGSSSTIDKYIQIGLAMGVRGTPVILFQDGSMLRGSIPASIVERRINGS